MKWCSTFASIMRMLNCTIWTCLAQSKPVVEPNFFQIETKMGCITHLCTKKDEAALPERL